jgi:hypothetical protein
MTPHEVRTYTLKLFGFLDDDFVPANCPAGTIQEQDSGCTWLKNIQTDQSGILGLMRHLHNLGYSVLVMIAETFISSEQSRSVKPPDKR